MSETVDIRELNDLIASKSSFVNMITQGMDQVIVGSKTFGGFTDDRIVIQRTYLA